jgi:hypothetical protein
MKNIPLTKGKFAIVDDEDFEYLNKWRWKYHKDGYAVRTATKNKNIYMHREINKTPKGVITDHINRNGLDNRKLNLRNSSFSQNALNTGLWKHNTSGFKGVFWNSQHKKWQASVNIGKKVIHLGFFVDIQNAKLAREEWDKSYAI